MNGESAFGWIKALTALAVLAILGYVAYKLASYLKGKSPADVVFDAGDALKNNTPFGLPSRAIDAGITAATGKEYTLGTFIYDVFHPGESKTISAPISVKKPDASVLLGGTNDIYVGDLPMGDIALPNPRDAR